MALVSMTGYGRGSAVYNGIKVEVELSSVNRKQFDLRFSLPRNMAVLESRLRNCIHDTVSRGYVTGIVKVGGDGDAMPREVFVDSRAAERYLKELRSAGEKLGLSDDLTLRSLLRLPDVVRYSDMCDDADKMWPVLEKALKSALSGLMAMRKTEGLELERDVRGRLDQLARRLDSVRKSAPAVSRKYQKRLKEKMKDSGIMIGKTDERIQKEILLFVDRSDISEEIVRLDSHFMHFHKLLKGKEPAGRSLDFLCQEMFREINTIGSKSNDAGISGDVVKFKSSLECIREQVQNIE